MSEASKKKVMLSAVQPSSGLTLGNYIGALRNWVKFQRDYECWFFAVNLHAITVRQDPKELREQTYRAVAAYLAAGIDPAHATLFVQSQVPACRACVAAQLLLLHGRARSHDPVQG